VRLRVYTGQAKCKESTSKLGHVYQGRFALFVSIIKICTVTDGCSVMDPDPVGPEKKSDPKKFLNKTTLTN
jgi:hypothetical protein